MEVIAGIDPGLSGALCVLNGSSVLALDHLPIHLTQHGRTGKVRSELDLHTLRGLLILHGVSHVFLERVAARPGQGVVSMFRFAEAAGGIYGVVVGLGIAASFVTPQQWQKHHGVGGAPGAARQRALQLFPEMASALARKKDDHRCDALLIAVYARTLLAD